MAKNEPNKPDEVKTAEETAALSHEDGAVLHEADKDRPEEPLGKALPNKQFLNFPVRENLKNVQVSIHLPCLQFSGTSEKQSFSCMPSDFLEDIGVIRYNDVDGQFNISQHWNDILRQSH
ncbi:MAG: hypothetical protein VB078_03195 [Clostridiaceae bacterium]|nr:hypothetical protein [Clostridiaceae bacterium]